MYYALVVKVLVSIGGLVVGAMEVVDTLVHVVFTAMAMDIPRIMYSAQESNIV